ncbi:hypothetical protein E0I26_06510 [Flavobacterium rhamnosiphilum]|uniref:DUF3278 domain-containing protein n=1 Tax=Flavobacterium rhamnosiphilum TaxID=2541724 RepID=A0A4R5FAX7_9FLAO|nr:hypothetical protein [Flavobacterium rhamnosiphilum]TDE45594.1 hypothetical protein E0I26_06510 [Flavobacterium rhamnosiphilum]
MDFKDIQSAWNNDTDSDIKVPTNLEKLKSANMPLEKIRKNLRFELINQFLALVFIGLIPLCSKFPANMITPYYFLYAIMFAVSIYYLVKLFLFFKRLNTTVLNTKDNLYETYYDIRLNMELYKTFTFALGPFIMMYLTGYFLYKNPDLMSMFSGDIIHSKLVPLLVTLVFSILLVGFLTEIWVHYFYGKYAKQIRKVLDELKEE